MTQRTAVEGAYVCYDLLRRTQAEGTLDPGVPGIPGTLNDS